MSKVAVTKDKLDYLANAISVKSGEPLTLTLDEMIEAVDGIDTETNLQAKTYTVSAAGTEMIEADSGYDGLSEVEVTVPGGSVVGPTADYSKYADSAGSYGGYLALTINAVPTTPSVQSGFVSSTSSSSRQVTTKTYYPFNPTITVSDDTVTIPSGYYSAQSTKTVASGTEGTPTATKGTVSNHAISVTPSVTNSAGYISGGTKTGTAVSVSASELVSGNLAITENGNNIDVSTYSTVSVDVSGGQTTETIVPEQTLNVSTAYTQVQFNKPLIEDEEYIVTINGVAKTLIAQDLYGSINIQYETGIIAIEWTGTGMYFDVLDASRYGTYTVKVEKVTGGGEYTRTVIVPQQTVTPNNDRQVEWTVAETFEAGKNYIITLDSVEWLTTCKVLWSDNYCVGDTEWFFGSSATDTVYPFGGIGYQGTTTIFFANTNQHTIKIERLDFITDGTTLITKNITQNGTYDAEDDDADGYSSVTVNVSGSSPTINSLSVTPSETEQTFNSSSVDGYKPVTVGAISSTYVGSGIDRRDSTDLSATGDTVTVPSGYYSTQATKAVSAISLPTSASASATSGYTSKATISPSTSAQYINIGTGYNSAGAYYKINEMSSMTLPTSASASATSGYTSKATISPNTSDQYINIPTGYNSAGAYYKINAMSTMTLPTSTSASATSGYTSKATVSRSTSDQYINIPVGYNSAGAYYKISAVANGSATGPSSLSGSSATVSTGTNTITLTKTGVTTTPTVSAGYVSSATASTATVALTASVTTKAAATFHPSTTAQSISSGTYLTGAQTIAAVTTSNLSASNIVSGVTIKVGDSSDDDCVASVTGNVVLQNYYTGSSAPSSATGNNGDLYLQT